MPSCFGIHLKKNKCESPDILLQYMALPKKKPIKEALGEEKEETKPMSFKLK